MPIDPSIPLSIRPPAPLSSVLDTYAQIQQLQALKSAGEERRAAAQDAQAKRQREAQIDAAMQEAIVVDPVTQQPTVDYGKLLGAKVPATALFEVKKIIDATGEQAAKLQETNLSVEQKKAAYLAGIARATAAAGHDPDAFKFGIVGAKKVGALSQEETDALLDAAERDPASIQRWATGAIARASTAQPETGFTLSPGQVRYGPGGQQIAAGPPKEPETGQPPNVGSFEDYVVRRFGPTPTFEQITQARKDYQQADDRPRITVNAGVGQADDVKTIVQGMIDGTLPPQLPGRASPAYNAIMAEAQRRGYNLAGAVTDWTATQKHTATMNGAQQLRLNQAINALPEMLDNVETLAKQWKAGRFAALNKISLAAAKHGVYGQQAATIANQLDAQIADVVADLGNVYMGGNSPTDHALGLAAKSLNAEWSEKVLVDMVALAKKNVQIRRNSINSTGVAGASEGNPYAPAAPTGPPVDTSGGRGAGPGMTYQDYLRQQGSR